MVMVVLRKGLRSPSIAMSSLAFSRVRFLTTNRVHNNNKCGLGVLQRGKGNLRFVTSLLEKSEVGVLPQAAESGLVEKATCNFVVCRALLQILSLPQKKSPCNFMDRITNDY